jgi:hypothetical protein
VPLKGVPPGFTPFSRTCKPFRLKAELVESMLSTFFLVRVTMVLAIPGGFGHFA